MAKECNAGDRCRPSRPRSLWRRCHARTPGTPPAERETSEGPRQTELRPVVRSLRRYARPAWRPGAATARIAFGERGPPPPWVPVHSLCYFSSFSPAAMSVFFGIGGHLHTPSINRVCNGLWSISEVYIVSVLDWIPKKLASLFIVSWWGFSSFMFRHFSSHFFMLEAPTRAWLFKYQLWDL